MISTAAVLFLALAISATKTHVGAQASKAAQVSRTTRQGRRLNVVFIVSDDERVQGNAVMHDVQRLVARTGSPSRNFHVTTSECGPSRASILLGEYSHHTGVTDNFGPHSYPAFNGRSDLAVWLRRSGYTTALVGKYLNDYTLDGASPGSAWLGRLAGDRQRPGGEVLRLLR